VTGGLWPAELSTITAQTAPLARHLKGIVDAANKELEDIRRAGSDGTRRKAAEARIINEARAFASQRVESTVRFLRAGHNGVPALNEACGTDTVIALN
jgi:hypothetical protein